jgi:hypothetical protein
MKSKTELAENFLKAMLHNYTGKDHPDVLAFVAFDIAEAFTKQAEIRSTPRKSPVIQTDKPK